MSTCVLLKLWRVATDTRSGPLVILYYDYFLTFDKEYQRIWKNRKFKSSILFFLNRYLPLLGVRD